MLPHNQTPIHPIALAKPCWLFAQTCRLVKGVGLLVYRSVYTDDTDSWYAPVADLLLRSSSEVLHKEESIRDTSMIFSEASWIAYRLLDLSAEAMSGGFLPIHPRFTEYYVRARGVPIMSDQFDIDQDQLASHA